MIEYLVEFLLKFSIISLALCFLRSLRKGFFMALLTSTSKHPSSSSSSSTSIVFLGNINLDLKRQKISSFKDQGQNRHREENNEFGRDSKEKIEAPREEEESIGTMMIKQSLSRKRPAQLVVPAFCPTLNVGELGKKLERKEFQVEGEGFALANKKGRREVMEDGHSFMLDISDSSKQAFFAVIDGHGGRAATDFVAENLGKNIINEIKLGENVGNHHEIQAAVRRGYSVTDHQLLNQKVRGGACAASVLVKDGELHVANVGDCKVILSRKGVANALTNDHRLNREDERARIENSGGFLDCRNGVWRVNGTLAVSRAFGDFYLKDHVISEPETLQLPLTSDCDFLIMASDGLWDKVGEQEAVDVVVSRKKDALESCKDLVSMASSRGGVDDVTALVVNLQNFVN